MFQCLAFFFSWRESLLPGWCISKSGAEFPYNPRLNAALVLFGVVYIFNFASICGVKSRVAFIRVITVYESTTSFSELFQMYISASTDIFFSW